ncbi:MAG TPA: metal-dependent transcriptional regulator [Caldisericia bacterium]|jgi:DtxR family Mn-dependent transcriptional regulator|nr:metal-dependent transcriptional regulator [Caldisericia bacterium]
MVDKLISASLEDYLEALYIFHKNNRHIRITDIGEFLNVKKPSVVHALKHLSDLGLIRKEKYGEIILTKKGLSKGKKIFTRHTTIKKFLTELLEIDEENANIEACKLEHILSEETFNKINEFISKRNEK